MGDMAEAIVAREESKNTKTKTTKKDPSKELYRSWRQRGENDLSTPKCEKQCRFFGDCWTLKQKGSCAWKHTDEEKLAAKKGRAALVKQE